MALPLHKIECNNMAFNAEGTSKSGHKSETATNIFGGNVAKGWAPWVKRSRGGGSRGRKVRGHQGQAMQLPRYRDLLTGLEKAYGKTGKKAGGGIA